MMQLLLSGAMIPEGTLVASGGLLSVAQHRGRYGTLSPGALLAVHFKACRFCGAFGLGAVSDSRRIKTGGWNEHYPNG